MNEGAAKTLDHIRAIRVTAVKKNKCMVLSEVGWTSGGHSAKTGVTSPEGQANIFSDLLPGGSLEQHKSTAGTGEEVEANFGVFQEDDSMKLNSQQLTIGWKDPHALANICWCLLKQPAQRRMT
ncbi:glycoside hydrolase 3 protein [Phytophthora pseudosyringae]|uniref:Glycoside hydrolase 3 protein n=1 Tax=Phytophthora pseudosyringae TaxID=221518 RepID=A0A8T1VTJ2_9STRA|nr:glycoside hydrolase 3 protein [Phytophthora pseudosyringae]